LGAQNKAKAIEGLLSFQHVQSGHVSIYMFQLEALSILGFIGSLVDIRVCKKPGQYLGFVGKKLVWISYMTPRNIPLWVGGLRL
jgi:hypothetical protein